MAKKTLLLNEATTRRFMRLAEIGATHASSFINELEDEEMAMDAGPVDPAAPEGELGPADIGAEEEEEELPPEDGEGGDSITLDAEQFVGDIVSLLQDAGADIELDTGAEEMPDEELPAEEPGMEEPGMEEVPAEDEEMMMQEVARRVTRRLLDAAKLSKATK